MAEKKPFDVFQEWMDSYLNFEKLPKKDIFWLNTMDFLCDRFDRPERSYRSVHIAGSKGKGSVSSMVASILQEAGFSCGLYTSPHILDLTERIGTAYGPLDEKTYEAAILEIIPRIKSILIQDLPSQREPTWFELITLFAFICFKKEKVDWGVFETGLGGRLDATNVLQPDVCIITPIELEHTEYLGDTLEKIAYEKAGIIKPNIPVCISRQRKECKQVFFEKSKENNSPIIFIDDVVEHLGMKLTKTGMETIIDFGKNAKNIGFSRPLQTNLRLLGNIQAENAALAALAVKTIYPELDEDIIEKGLANAFLPGRIEILQVDKQYISDENIIYNFSDIPFIVIDGAHTETSVKYTLQTFFDLLNVYDIKNISPILLFACAADKHCESFAHLIKNLKYQFSDIILTIPGRVKQSDLSKLIDSFSEENISFSANENYEQMIKDAFCIAAKRKLPLLITGSFYLVAEVKKILALL